MKMPLALFGDDISQLQYQTPGVDGDIFIDPSFDIKTSRADGIGMDSNSGSSSGLDYNNLLGTLMLTQAFNSGTNAITSAFSARHQARYQANQLEFNAEMARIAARDVFRRADINSANIGERARKSVSDQRGYIAAQGIDPNTLDAADLQAQSQRNAALDALQTQNNAWRQAWGYEVRASNLEWQRRGIKDRFGSTLLSGGLQALQYGLQAAYFYGTG